MAAVLAVSGPALAAPPPSAFEIRSTTLSTALMAFAEQAKMQVVMNDADLRGFSAQPLRGRYDPAEALRRLIGRAPVEVEWIGSTTIAVRAAHARLQPVVMTSQVTQDTAPVVVENKIEEIVVTARRREEQLQDVPIPIVALSGDQLARRGITKTGDLTAGVPGVFVSPGSSRGSNSPTFAIRGQVNRDPSATADPSIGLYFAEVPWARVTATNAALFDLQSVQALKGPQGTLFGRNSTGGAILLTPNAPTDAFGGYGKVATGSFGLFEAEGVLNAPLGDTLSLRLAGRYQKRDGYMRAVNTGLVSGDLNNKSLRASLKWEPGARLSSTTIATYYRTDTNGDGFRLYGIAPGPPTPTVAAAYPRYVDGLRRMQAVGKYEYITGFSPAVAAVLISGVPSVFLTKPQATAQAWSLQNTSTYELGSFGALGELLLKNIVGYRNVHDVNTFETTPIDFLNIQTTNTSHLNQISDEFQLQGKTQRLSYILGAFYFHEHAHEKNRTYSNVPVQSLSQGIIRNTAYSAFAHFDYALSATRDEGFGISGGIRFNHDERRLLSSSRRQTTPGQSTAPLYTCTLQPAVPVNNGSLCRIAFKTEFSVPTWDLGLNYKFTPQNMIYASWSRGYRAGGFNFTATSLAAIGPYLPEKVYNYEVGSKNDFTLGGLNGRLNIGAFYTDYRDIQRTLNSLNAQGQNSLTTVNAAKARIIGSEVELVLKPSRALELSLSYSYLKPKYLKFVDRYIEPTNGIAYPIDVSDSEFILVSRHALSATATYTLPVDEKFGEASLLATYYYRTGFYNSSDINTAHCRPPGDPNPSALYPGCYNHLGRVPGYGLVNLRLDWRGAMGSRIDVAFYINNVADNYYYETTSNALGSLGTIEGLPGLPRTFGVELRAPFGS